MKKTWRGNEFAFIQRYCIALLSRVRPQTTRCIPRRHGFSPTGLTVSQSNLLEAASRTTKLRQALGDLSATGSL